MFVLTLCVAVAIGVLWTINLLLIQPLFSPLRNLPGPEAKKGLGFQGHLNEVLKWDSAFFRGLETKLEYMALAQARLNPHTRNIPVNMEEIYGLKVLQMYVFLSSAVNVVPT